MSSNTITNCNNSDLELFKSLLMNGNDLDIESVGKVELIDFLAELFSAWDSLSIKDQERLQYSYFGLLEKFTTSSKVMRDAFDYLDKIKANNKYSEGAGRLAFNVHTLVRLLVEENEFESFTDFNSLRGYIEIDSNRWTGLRVRQFGNLLLHHNNISVSEKILLWSMLLRKLKPYRLLIRDDDLIDLKEFLLVEKHNISREERGNIRKNLKNVGKYTAYFMVSELGEDRDDAGSPPGTNFDKIYGGPTRK